MNTKFQPKKIVILIPVIFSMFFIAACSSESDGSSNSNEETYTIKFSHTMAEDHPDHIAAKAFKKEVEDESDGQIEVDIYPSGQLYESETKAAEAVQLNNIQVTAPTTADLANLREEFSLFNLPFLFKNREAAHKALDGEVGDKLNNDLSEENLIGLGFGENGFRHYFNTKHPIEKPDDFSGLKTRVIENKLYLDMFNGLGAEASPLAFGELYTALQQGTFDGADSEITVASSENFDEVSDYLSLTGHTFTATELIASKDFYENLPDDLQKIVDKAGEVYQETQREETAEQEQERLDDFEKTLEINELTDEQKDVFRDELEPLYDKYEDNIGKDLIDSAKKANE